MNSDLRINSGESGGYSENNYQSSSAPTDNTAANAGGSQMGSSSNVNVQLQRQPLNQVQNTQTQVRLPKGVGERLNIIA